MEIPVNPEILKGRWNQLKGDIRTRWGKLPWAETAATTLVEADVEVPPVVN
jgi:hypothetical protein